MQMDLVVTLEKDEDEREKDMWLMMLVIHLESAAVNPL